MRGYTIVKLDEVDDVLGDYPGEMRDAHVRDSARSRSRSPTGGCRSTPAARARTATATRRRRRSTSWSPASCSSSSTTRSSSAARHGDPRRAREVVRSVWNDEPEDAELVIVSKRIDDPMGDTENIEDFWPA